jgi:hypothetical protein
MTHLRHFSTVVGRGRWIVLHACMTLQFQEAVFQRVVGTGGIICLHYPGAVRQDFSNRLTFEKSRLT